MKTSNQTDQWERRVLAEIDREHEHICRTHKVCLRRVAIMLFDCETRWGQFDELTRTISISRKLIQEHPWHAVIGVLRHVMAHQLVAESRPLGGVAGRSHDEQFRVACRKLGVPDHFSRAGIDLQKSTLDWREEKRDEKTEKILEKVRKLLSLANSSNEHEAQLAMDRVREIYAKYNMEDREDEVGFVHVVIAPGNHKIQSWQQRAISILLEHFFVTALTFRQYDLRADERRVSVELIGSRENVIMAEYVYYFLQNQLESSVRKAAKAKDRKFGRRERNSYRLGILDGFGAKLRAAEGQTLKEKVDENQPGLTLVGKAVLKFKKDNQLSEYLSEMYPRLTSRKAARRSIDLDAFHSGREIGRDLNLNKPLSSQMGNLGKALT